MSDLVAALRDRLGATGLLTGADMAAWSRDWPGNYAWTPLCVARPRSTEEVSEVVRAARAARVAVVPVSGHTGVSGGTYGEGAVMLSLDRMTAIEEIRPEARLAVVQAGVILSDLHAAAADRGLSFPMTFGARGTARIGGLLATNAGGSNVLRHGNTRDLVLGLEAVLADGRVVNLMSELHKNNAGYDLRHLLIGSEGTLGIITRAVLKLVPAPGARATAMVALSTVSAALGVLNRLQDVTGGAVEAFEYMPGSYLALHADLHPESRAPFETAHEVTVLVELAATAPRDVAPGPDGKVPLAGHLEQVLGEMLEAGVVLDAVVAQNDAQRAEMWARREAAAEVSYARRPTQANDVSVPLDRVEAFLARADALMARLDPGARSVVVAHLGDGNVHYVVQMGRDDAALAQALMTGIEEVVVSLGGSFSAEHGIGLAKRRSMAQHKNPVALEMMRAIKRALDPDDILNPGKLLPD